MTTKKNTVLTGIWLNQEKAYMVTMKNDNPPEIQLLKSGVDSIIRFPGERKMYTRFGNAIIDDQEKKQRRQYEQRKRYFREIIKKVQKHHAVLLFGPGKAKDELFKEMAKTPGLKKKVLAVETSDRMTRNQLKAYVKKMFREKYPAD